MDKALTQRSLSSRRSAEMAVGPPRGFSVCLVLILLVSVSAKLHRRHHVPDDQFLRRADSQNQLKKRPLSGQLTLKPHVNSFSTENHGTMENQGPRGGQTNFLNSINLVGKYSSEPRDFSTVYGKPLLELNLATFKNLDLLKLNQTTFRRRVPVERHYRFSGLGNFPAAHRATIDARCCALLSGIFCISVSKLRDDTR